MGQRFILNKYLMCYNSIRQHNYKYNDIRLKWQVFMKQ